MASEVKYAQAKKTLAPLPQTARGYGIHIDANKKDNLLLYTNGNHVILRSLADPSVADVFSEHRGSKVNVAKFSPNGEWVASGDDKGRVLVWAVKSKIIKNDVQACRRILDLDWSSDGQRIVAVGDGSETKAKVFAWNSGNNFGEITGHSKPILSCSFKPTRPFRIITASEDNTLCFHSGPPFAFTSAFNGHTRYPNCVRYSPDGNHFVSVGADFKVFLFKGDDASLVREFEGKEGHTGSVYSVCWSADNKQVLTASADKTVKLWDVETGSVVKTFTFGDSIDDYQVAVAWCGEYMISISLSGAINYLNIDNPAMPKKTVVGHQAQIMDLSLEQKSSTLYSSDMLGNIAKWDLASGSAQLFTGKPQGNKVVIVNSLAVNTSGDVLLSTGYDDKVRLNNATDAIFSDNTIPAGGMPYACAFSKTTPDLAVFTVSQGKLVVVKGGQITCTLAIKYKPICVDISPDDAEFAVGGDDKKVHIYSLANNQASETSTLGDHADNLEAITYSPDGKWLASSDSGRHIFVRDRANGNATRNPLGWKMHSGKVTSLAWSPDSTRIASGSQDQSILIWTDLTEFDSGKRRELAFAHIDGVTRLRWADNATLVSVGNDRVIKTWDL